MKPNIAWSHDGDGWSVRLVQTEILKSDTLEVATYKDATGAWAYTAQDDMYSFAPLFLLGIIKGLAEASKSA